MAGEGEGIFAEWRDFISAIFLAALTFAVFIPLRESLTHTFLRLLALSLPLLAFIFVLILVVNFFDSTEKGGKLEWRY